MGVEMETKADGKVKGVDEPQLKANGDRDAASEPVPSPRAVPEQQNGSAQADVEAAEPIKPLKEEEEERPPPQGALRTLSECTLSDPTASESPPISSTSTIGSEFSVGKKAAGVGHNESAEGASRCSHAGDESAKTAEVSAAQAMAVATAAAATAMEAIKKMESEPAHVRDESAELRFLQNSFASEDSMQCLKFRDIVDKRAQGWEMVELIEPGVVDRTWCSEDPACLCSSYPHASLKNCTHDSCS